MTSNKDLAMQISLLPSDVLDDMIWCDDWLIGLNCTVQEMTSNGQYEDPIDEYLDQIDELTHKLSVAEAKLTSLQSSRKSASNI